MDTNRGPWIQTLTGIRWHLADPRVEDVDIRDIARGLSIENRFSGQTMRPYSVAQHSVGVAMAAKTAAREMGWTLQNQYKVMAAGLLHDAHEAYYKDIPKPLKVLIPDYQRLEQLGQDVVRKKFGIDTYSDDIWDLAEHIDAVILISERDAIQITTSEWANEGDVQYVTKEMRDHTTAWTWWRAEREFLYLYNVLQNMTVL